MKPSTFLMDFSIFPKFQAVAWASHGISEKFSRVDFALCWRLCFCHQCHEKTFTKPWPALSGKPGLCLKSFLRVVRRTPAWNSKRIKWKVPCLFSQKQFWEGGKFSTLETLWRDGYLGCRGSDLWGGKPSGCRWLNGLTPLAAREWNASAP